MARAARRAGYTNIVQTDIADRGVNPLLCHQIDFLAENIYPYNQGRPNIIGNPPYGMPYKGICVDMTLRALELAHHQVCMLYQQKFQSGGVRWRRLLDQHRPRSFYIFADRPSMPPGHQFLAGEVKRGGGTKDYIAIVWDKTYNGPTITEWLFKPGHVPRGMNGKAKKAAPAGGE